MNQISSAPEKFMEIALLQAEKAFSEGEVPVGAVAVFNGEVVAATHNRTEQDCCAAAHAEILLLQSLGTSLGRWRLTDIDIYVTLEPCTMCASALRLARVRGVYFGAPDRRFGGFGSLADFREHTVFGPTCHVVGGILEERSARLLKRFFQERRKGPLS